MVLKRGIRYAKYTVGSGGIIEDVIYNEKGVTPREIRDGFLELERANPGKVVKSLLKRLDGESDDKCFNILKGLIKAELYPYISPLVTGLIVARGELWLDSNEMNYILHGIRSRNTAGVSAFDGIYAGLKAIGEDYDEVEIAIVHYLNSVPQERAKEVLGCLLGKGGKPGIRSRSAKNLLGATAIRAGIV